MWASGHNNLEFLQYHLHSEPFCSFTLTSTSDCTEERENNKNPLLIQCRKKQKEARIDSKSYSNNESG